MYKFREFERDTIVPISYQVNEAFCCAKGLCDIKKLFFGADNYTGVFPHISKTQRWEKEAKHGKNLPPG